MSRHKGESIFDEGDSAKEMYFIIKGRFHLYRNVPVSVDFLLASSVFHAGGVIREEHSTAPPITRLGWQLTPPREV
jgi:CRP-like cAMP-binding protein